MIVLRGATSQWKRPRCGSSPIGPASGPPRQTAGIVVEVRAHRVEIERRDRARSSAASSSSMRASRKSSAGARQDHADVDQLAALDARHDADDRVVVGVLSGHAAASSTNARGARQPLDEIAPYAARVGRGVAPRSSHASGISATIASMTSAVSSVRQPLVLASRASSRSAAARDP